MRQRFEYRDANRKAAYAATRRSRVGQRTFNVLALALLFVLVFSLALVAVVGGANGKFNVAEAAKSQTATKRSASSIAKTGTNFAAEFNNNHTSTYAKYFGIDSEVDATTDNFKWGSRGWGFDDVDLDGSDNAIVYWIEWEFSGTALAAIQQNRASFYVSATSTYSGDTFEFPEETALAFQWVGVQTASPSTTHVDSERGGNTANWSSSVSSSTFAYKTGWGNGSASAEWGTISSGAYQASSPVPTKATGARLICYVITDQNIKGGIHDLNFSLYEKPADSLSSTNYQYSLDGTLYGENYTIQIPDGKKNWNLNTEAYESGKRDWDKNKPYMYLVEEGATDYYSEYTATDATLSNSNSKTDLRNDGDYLHTWSHKPNSTNASGVLVSHGRDVCEFYFAMTFEITLPAYVTEVQVTGNLFTAGYNKQKMASNDETYITAQAQLYDGSQTPDTSKKALFTATPLATNAGDECKTSIKSNATNSASGYESSCTTKAFTLNSGAFTASSSKRVFTVALYVHFRKEDISTSLTGWGDYGQYYAMMGDVKVNYKGKYWVKYDANGGSGSMGIKEYGSTANTQEFIYGTAEPMQENGFKRTDYTFVGWALDKVSSVKYKNKYSTGDGDVTQLSGGEVITLYAVWRESDFGVLPGKTRDTNWGSESNPFVISELEHWHNLVDIVNKVRDPVDSVKGTYYDNKIENTIVSYTSFYKGYFAVTADLDLGNISPIGDELSTAFGARNFKGHIYGADDQNNKVMHKISVDIDSDKDSVGLFGLLGGDTSFDTTIEYLELTGTVKTTGKYAGGFVGSAFGTYSKIIRNCKSSVNVIAASFNTANQATSYDGVAGFVGSTIPSTSSKNCKLVIENCEYVGGTKYTVTDTDGKTAVDANIFGHNGVGGILGYVSEGGNTITISNCKVSGTIQGYQNVGGIGGRIETTNTAADSIVFKNLYNSANISVSNQTAGGIVGYFYGNSTGTNNVATLQYAYNCGTIKGETASKNYVGGIVGEAKKNTAGSVTVKNCYNAGTISNSNSTYTGSICGQTTYTTITDCWQLNNGSTVTPVNHAMLGSHNTDVKVFSALYGTTILPAELDGATLESSWDAIVDKDIQAFGIFGTETSVEDGKYLSIYSASSEGGTSGSVQKPTHFESTIAESISSVNLMAKNLIFNASLSNYLTVVKKDITTVTTAITKTYGETAPSYTDWISYSSNNYSGSEKVFYENSGVWNETAPKSANASGYAVRVALYNNDVMVGAKYLSGAYKINKKKISVKPTWTDGYTESGKHAQYTGAYLGVLTFTIDGAVYDEMPVKATYTRVTNGPTEALGNGTYCENVNKLQGAVDYNSVAYSITFALDGSGDNGNHSNNYDLKVYTNSTATEPLSNKILSWYIDKRVLEPEIKWTSGTTGTFTYNGGKQGIDTITFNANGDPAFYGNESLNFDADKTVSVDASGFNSVDGTYPAGKTSLFDGQVTISGVFAATYVQTTAYKLTITCNDNFAIDPSASSRDITFTINKRTITPAVTWTSDTTGTYNRKSQGLNIVFAKSNATQIVDKLFEIFESFTLKFTSATDGETTLTFDSSNFTEVDNFGSDKVSGGNAYIGAENDNNAFTLTAAGIDANANGNSYALTYKLRETSLAQSYDITLDLDPWTIAPKTIEGAGENDIVLFGHGGEAYNESFATNTETVTAASLGRDKGTFFSLIGDPDPENAVPLLFYTESAQALYTDIRNYIIYFADAPLVYGDTKDFILDNAKLSNATISQGTLTFTFDSDGIALVSLTFAGVGNFTGEFSREFYLMQHDFASETEKYDETWGTAANPYFIKTEQHFLRLSAIVNGAKHGSVKAWDSLTGDNSVLGSKGFVKATKRSYEGAYFKLAADKEFTLSLDMGFEPIGYTSVFCFSASFDGNSSHIKLTLSYSSGQSYMGLFGYLSAGETEEKPYVINMNITANLSATLGTGVGAIAGYAVGYNIYGDNSLSTTIRVPNGKELGGAIGNAQNCDFGYAPEGFAGTNRISVSGNGGISSYSNYIGGVFGRVNNCRVFHVADGNPAGTTPEDEAFVISSVAPVNANLSGGQSMYVGGIAGEWILGAGDAAEQFNDSIRLDAGNLVVIGSAYVGGIVGYLDASASTGYLVYTPHIAYGSSGFSINVYANYMVGGLFGVFVGNGYRDTSDSLDVLSKYTKIILSPSNVKLKVNLGVIPESDSSGKGSAIGVGGLFGYVGGAGVLFTDDWDAASQTPIAAASNYTVESVKVMGSIAGVIGNNATLESSTQDGAGESGKPVQITVGSSAFGSLKASVWGAIAGAVANTAGTFNGTAITVFGNRIALVNRFDFSSNSSNDYVGGLFGVLGKLPQDDVNGLGIGSMFSDLVNVLWSGVFDEASSVVASGNYVAFAPQIESNGIVPAGYGRAINTASVTGQDYVGGLVGYVGDGGRLDLANRAYTSRPSGTGLDEILDVFVGNPALNNGTSKSVQGRQHVGGIAGYLAAGTHMIDRMVTRLSFVCSTISGGNYIGGYFGDMGGGTVQNSLVLYNSSSQNLSVGSNVVAYASANSSAYVGGIAGMAQGVTASNTYVMNFQYSTLSDTKGGIFGSSDASSSATSAWALMMTSSGATTTTTTSANSNGKYVIFDADALNNGAVPNFDQLAVMTGIYAFDVGNQANEVESDYNKAEYGKLSFAAITPATNSQLALVDGNGNTTKIAFDSFRNGKAIGYGSSNENRQTVMFKMSNASDSLVVAVVDIVIKDIPKGTANGKATMSGDSYANAYRPPLADRNFYRISYDSGSMYVEFDGNGNAQNVTTDVITQKGVGGAGIVYLGHYYSGPITAGDTSEAPFTISDLDEWKDFIKNFSKNNKYSEKFVKLLADISGVELGNSTFVANNFAGTFDGNGHTITVSYTGNGNGISLFPYANGAIFKNLTIEGTINAASSLGDYNTASYGTGGDYGKDWDKGCGTAAFVGSPDGTVTFENCTNAATVTGTKDVGGFVGRINKGTKYTFVTCVNKGTIKSITGQHTEQYASYPFGVGGIIGRSTISLTIESCRNVGNVTGGHNVGGIIGLCMGDLTVYNSANTGTIFAHIGDETLWDNATNGNDVNGIFGYAGGIVGRTGGRVDPSSKDSAGIGSLSAYACYNTGEIKCTGNVAGGIAGATCEIVPNASLLGIKTEKDLVYVGSKGTKIAYCYNTGNITVGAKNALYADNYTLGGRCEFGGTIAGGIVGVWSKGFVKYCYNTGTITGHGVVGGNLTWQSRIGGIAGQTEPTATNQVTFTYCYNIGEIILNITGFTSIAGISIGSDVRYGAGISGYTDRTDEISKSVTSNTTYCYTLKNCVASYLGTVSAANCKYRGEENKWDPGGDADFPDAAQPGTKVDSLADLTAYIGSDGYVQATKMIGGGERSSSQSMVGSGETGAYINTFNDETNEVNYNRAFLNATLNGYIYIYGCIPTLAMFALGTKEGLSMMSVSYGQDENGDFVGAQAGSKQSPYIIKDGVDLLGMQTLVNASEGDNYFYTFRNKYIEFANASEGNNIDNLTVTSIDMSTLKNNYSEESNQGKNRFLYTMSAAGGGKDFPATAGSAAGSNNLSGWTANNHYFSGTSASTSSGATFSDVNYLPAGYMGGDTDYEYRYRFEGSFNALGGTISNLKIVQNHDYRAYAGLFGKTKNATISNVKLTGASIKAYFTSTLDNEKDGSVAGGIVAWMGGGTTIDNCSVENSSIYAYANRSSSATNTTASNSYAGGIAGLIVSGRPSYASVTYTRGTTTSITNCVVGGSTGSVTISGYGSNIGGIVGAVANKALAYAYSPTPSGVNGTFVTLSGNKVQYSVSLSGLSSSHAQRYTGIGGIVGVVIGNDGPQTAILGCLVGRDTAADGSATTGNVTVTGAYDIGGIVGVVGGNTTIGTPEGATDYMSNCIVGKLAQIKADTYKSWSSASGRSNDYGIAVGGIVGRADSVTFNGVSYWGSITVGNTAAGAQNVGGIIGFMGTGTTFAEGARCDVTGSITISNGKSAGTGTANNQNIGGVAGSASDAAFSGTFIIQPTISLTGTAIAQNVGGFIGSNNGVIYVRARGTAIVIGGSISGTQNVGGFVGNNASIATLNIGLSGYMGQSDTGDLYIAIGATYETTGGALTYKPDTGTKITAQQNVGGLVGLNAVENGVAGSVVIEKGNIYNFAQVTATGGKAQNVGGIIGNNSGSLTTGATAASDAYSALRNYGAITGNKNVGGIIGLLDNGSVGGYFTNFGNVMGDVKGSSFVGGAIGRVSSSARIITPVDDNKLPSGDTLFRNGGMVKGTYFVGGSIGGMLGTIEGNETYQVTFRNTKLTGNLAGFDEGKTYDGTVGSLDVGDTKFGGAFIGGNIGIIMGTVKYGEFINDVEMTIDVASSSGHTSIGIGGSIGLIGDPDEMLSNFGFNDEHDQLMTELATHTAINISNSQFEFSGSIEVITTDKGEQKSHTHAVGGAVGGIVQTTGVTTTFDASNTFFANGNVIAETGISVGGIVGLISANGVNIYDVLAYETRVVGLKNVGGIVGEITGTDVAVNNTFNLLGTVEHTEYEKKVDLNLSTADKKTEDGYEEGQEFKGFTKRYVGGIIGKTAASTDADTSYWLLKGMSSKIIGNIVKDEKWRIKADGEGYAAALDGEDAYSTGTSHSGWYFLFANDGAIDGGGIDIYHLGDGSDDVSVRLGYWKRIANAYTIDERANELDKSFVEGIPQKVGDKFQVNGEEIVSGQLYGSQIVGRMESGSVTNGGQVTPGYLYVAAKAGAMGSFLRVDASLRASYTGNSYYGKDGEADYLHDANGLRAESIQMSPVGANGVTYFRFKINDALASSASGSGSSGGVGTNQLGNIGVYYQKINQNIDLGSASYTGEEIEIKYEQMPYCLRALLEGSNRKDVTEVSVVGGVAQIDKDRANSYGYAFRLATTGVKEDSNGDSVDKILNAGKYEGCIDIYLYDSDGVPKPVGYTNFGFVVTPAQITLKSSKASAIYTGKSAGETTDVDFLVGDTSFETLVGSDKFAQYIYDLQIYFAFASRIDGVLGDSAFDKTTLLEPGNIKFTAAGGSNDGYPTSFGYYVSYGVDYCLRFNQMRAIGNYQLYFGTSNRYTIPKYENGTWSEEEGDSFPTVSDGNYYFVGSVDENGATTWNDSKRQYYTFFTIDENGFNFVWKEDERTYGQTANLVDNRIEFEAATITAKENFESSDALRKVLKGIEITIQIAKGSSTTTKRLTLDGEKDGADYRWINAGNNKITLVLLFDAYADAAKYTPSTSTSRTNGDSQCTIEGGTNNSKSLTIYQQQVQAIFYDAKSGGGELEKSQQQGSATTHSYVYNAEQQGALRAIIKRINDSNYLALKFAQSPTITPKSEKTLSYNTGSLVSGVFTFTITNNSSINAGKYEATVDLKDSNYTFASGKQLVWGSTDSAHQLTVKWEITQLPVTVSIGNLTTVYDGNEHMPTVTCSDPNIKNPTLTHVGNAYQMEGLKSTDLLKFTLEITGDGNMAVNAGTYTITISNADDSDENYIVTASGSATITISKAQLTLTWDDYQAENPFTYNGSLQGRNVLASVTSSYKFGISGAQQLEIDGSSAVLTLTNAFGQTETITFALSGDVRMKNVGKYTMSISDSQTTLVGTNAGGNSTLGNFVIAYPEADAYYEIVAKQIDRESISVVGNENTSKTYDATTAVPAGFAFGVEFAGELSAELKAELASAYTLTQGEYDQKNVGQRTIGYTITLTSTNFVLVGDGVSAEGTSFSGTVAGEITPATLTVKLRSNSPSKVYDGNVFFGGDGWTGGSGSNSKVYQANNGFSVDGFISGDSDSQQIKATFSDDRTTSSASYDSYVNGADSKKTIKFELSGSDNYVLALEGGTVDSAKKVGTFNGGAITPKPIRATYRNTRQSYVTRDNKFNTEWIDIEGSLTGLVGDDARYVVLKVTNAWTSGEYKTYTVIRGSASSSLLKAEIVANASTTLGKPYDECYLNYTLTNQPVLTIGYFMSGDDFEIGSLSALLIATYYYWASTYVDDAGFNGFITQSTKVVVVSVADYDSNTGIESACKHGEKCSTWEEHIEKLMAEGKAVVQEGDEWVYYEASDVTDRTVYTSFKQIANISGVFTADDIAILNGMFTKTTFNEDGSTNTDNSYSWGVGSKYLENVIKVAAGNNITLLNAVFLDEFGGTYDGQGYTLDGFTIIGMIDSKNENWGKNVGFFTEVKDSATVKNVNLRNFNIITTVSENVGGLAGSAATTNFIENVTVHATINAQGATNVGGVVGSLASGSKISRVIALGSIYATATNVGGIAGTASGSIEKAVSMMYIYATATNVGGIAGSAGASVDGTYMTNAVWNNGSAITGGTSVSYTYLYNGSVSGYKSGKNYKSGSDYYLSTATSESDLKGAYDVIDEVTLDDYALGNSSAPNPRESMRLADLIDVYLLLYTLEETAYNEFRVFDISKTSWLVDNKHGTDKDGDRIVIANQQNVSLLRELRFAAFELTADVYMYDTYSLTPAKGAFFGSVEANDHHIYIKGRTDEEMFEALAAGVTLPIKSY